MSNRIVDLKGLGWVSYSWQSHIGFIFRTFYMLEGKRSSYDKS